MFCNFELCWESYSEAHQGQLMQEHLVKVHTSVKYYFLTSIHKIKHLHDTMLEKTGKTGAKQCKCSASFVDMYVLHLL